MQVTEMRLLQFMRGSPETIEIGIKYIRGNLRWQILRTCVEAGRGEPSED